METSEPEVTRIDYEQSPTIGKWAEALAAAQGEMENAAADSENPHFKSSYADLASIVKACRLPLAKNKIARHQAPVSLDGEVGVRTMLAHSSGEWVAATCWCKPQQPTAQGIGSVITYLRRYSLAAAVGVAQEDDDGEAAVGRPSSGPRQLTTKSSHGQDRAQAAGTIANDTEKAPPTAKAWEEALAALEALVFKKLAWKKPHAANWLKKHFGTSNPEDLTLEQLQDALKLAHAWKTDHDNGSAGKGEPEVYPALVAELQAAGRIRKEEAA